MRDEYVTIIINIAIFISSSVLGLLFIINDQILLYLLINALVVVFYSFYRPNRIKRKCVIEGEHKEEKFVSTLPINIESRLIVRYLQEVSGIIGKNSEIAKKLAKTKGDLAVDLRSIVDSIYFKYSNYSGISTECKDLAAELRYVLDSVQDYLSKLSEIFLFATNTTDELENDLGLLSTKHEHIRNNFEKHSNFVKQAELLLINLSIESARVDQRAEGVVVVANKLRDLLNNSKLNAKENNDNLKQLETYHEGVERKLSEFTNCILEANEYHINSRAQIERAASLVNSGTFKICDILSRASRFSCSQLEEMADAKIKVSKMLEIINIEVGQASKNVEISALLKESIHRISSDFSNERHMSSANMNL